MGNRVLTAALAGLLMITGLAVTTPTATADSATSYNEANYNCGGMVGIDFTKPGAQAFIDGGPSSSRPGAWTT